MPKFYDTTWYDQLTEAEAKEINFLDRSLESSRFTTRILMERREGIRNRVAQRRQNVLRKKKRSAEDGDCDTAAV